MVFGLGILWPGLTAAGALSGLLVGLVFGMAKFIVGNVYQAPSCDAVDDRPAFAKMHFLYYGKDFLTQPGSQERGETLGTRLLLTEGSFVVKFYLFWKNPFELNHFADNFVSLSRILYFGCLYTVNGAFGVMERSVNRRKKIVFVTGGDSFSIALYQPKRDNIALTVYLKLFKYA